MINAIKGVINVRQKALTLGWDESAARSAWSAAESAAESAAWSAQSARSARSAASDAIADEFIRLLEAA